MKHELTDIPGIGASTADVLAEHGIDSVKTLIKGGVKKLRTVPGFGEVRAVTTLNAAEDLISGDSSVQKVGGRIKT
ncbi:MAG: helix-hairpin-helix domain-containing protein [Mariprofundaceae bacterium]|nr:helix-hairpin-helix domain-containing protein [Mariprofundaceae bacterium]